MVFQTISLGIILNLDWKIKLLTIDACYKIDDANQKFRMLCSDFIIYNIKY